MPVYQPPRIVAGQSVAVDTNKCPLTPKNRTDTSGFTPFIEQQWPQMQTVVPSGVCDFTKPGVSQAKDHSMGDVSESGRFRDPRRAAHAGRSPAFGQRLGQSGICAMFISNAD
jgi:hypothetical protein